MNAAIYARKSTEQHAPDEAKSVTRQIAHAKEFARKQGWTVRPEHVFSDDGISGTEFARRPGLQDMLAARTSFQRLIVSEQKSLGREMVTTMSLIQQLALAGVEIVEYVHGHSLTPRTPIAKLLSSVQGFSDEDHGVKTGERVKESHTDLVLRGHVPGGRVFGFDNRKIYAGTDQHGNDLYPHTERVINRAEAAVVRRIFQLYVSGLGLKAIAKKLNNEKARSPRPFVRRDPTKVGPVVGWSPATIRSILHRDLYRGVVVWNRSRKRNDSRQVDQRPRPESEWVELPVNDDLRIVSDDLWNRAKSRRADTEGQVLRFASGRMSGRPPKTPTKNLLAGLASCGVCGGGLVVETSGRTRGRVPDTSLFRHRNHGTGVCKNQLHIAVAEMNEAVLAAVERHALTPEAIEAVVQLSEREDSREQVAALTRELRDVDKRIARLVVAVETARDIAPLADKLRELQARRVRIDDQLRSCRPVPRLARHVIETRLAEWRRLLRQSTVQGRAVIQRVLQGRIVFTPSGRGYTFEAPTRYDKLFSGVVFERPKFIPFGNTGAEHIGPEDTFDGDYGRLLAGVGKRDSSPAGFEPAF